MDSIATPSPAETLAAAIQNYAERAETSRQAEQEAATAASASARLIAASAQPGAAPPDVDDLLAADAAADRARKVAEIARAGASAALRQREAAEIGAWRTEAAEIDADTQRHYARCRGAAADVDDALVVAQTRLAELLDAKDALHSHHHRARQHVETVEQAVATNAAMRALEPAYRPMPRPVILPPHDLARISIAAMLDLGELVALGKSIAQHACAPLPPA